MQWCPSTPSPASASGLDPHISIANARLQVDPRRRASEDSTWQLSSSSSDKYTDGRQLRVLGEPGVNVVELNLALDATTP